MKLETCQKIRLASWTSLWSAIRYYRCTSASWKNVPFLSVYRTEWRTDAHNPIYVLRRSAIHPFGVNILLTGLVSYTGRYTNEGVVSRRITSAVDAFTVPELTPAYVRLSCFSEILLLVLAESILHTLIGTKRSKKNTRSMALFSLQSHEHDVILLMSTSLYANSCGINVVDKNRTKTIYIYKHDFMFPNEYAILCIDQLRISCARMCACVRACNNLTVSYVRLFKELGLIRRLRSQMTYTIFSSYKSLLMRLWHFSSYVNSSFKRACAAIQWG